MVIITAAAAANDNDDYDTNGFENGNDEYDEDNESKVLSMMMIMMLKTSMVM